MESFHCSHQFESYADFHTSFVSFLNIHSTYGARLSSGINNDLVRFRR